MIGEYQIDDVGRCYGFQIADESLEIEPFGSNLSVGDDVTLDDGGTGRIKEVYGRIHTQGSGGSNYVCVDIDVD